MTTTKPLLHLDNIVKHFGGVQALKGVSLQLMPGEIYHLLGENGCGKSTLIKIISGAQAPTSGQIIVSGKNFSELTPLGALALGIETVYQDLSLLPNLTVAENIGLVPQLVEGNGRLLKPIDRKLINSLAETALKRIGLEANETLLSTPVDKLPIALRQMVAIGRAIATNAKLVIMDEPTTALTQNEVDQLIEVVSGLQASGVTVIFVSHKLDECKTIGGNVIIFRDGRKIAEGPIADMSKEQIAELMTGKKLSHQSYKLSPPTNDILLEAKNIGMNGAFSGVNFTLHKGEVLGITGLLGSGRNEIARVIAGIDALVAGEILLESKALKLSTPVDAVNAGIGYVPEDRIKEGLFFDKSIKDNITVSVLDQLKGRLGLLDNSRKDNRANTLKESLKIATKDMSLPIQSLSGGNQQRVVVGRWLAIEPKVLVLHAPTMGVDVGSKDALYRIVQDLVAKGVGVLMVSDDLPELLSNCDRILLMRNGTLEADLPVAGLNEETLSSRLLRRAA